MVGLYIIFIAYIVLSICGFIVMVGALQNYPRPIERLKNPFWSYGWPRRIH